MKTPLRFQVTEYDCGTISLLNAISFLFEREEIPAELVRMIHLYTLDCADEKGNVGAGGTSREAISKLTSWITDYANSNDFNIMCRRLVGEEVALDKMKECLSNNGCVLVRGYLEVEHYTIITKIDKKHAYIFDPYYLDKNAYNNDKDIKIILNKPFTHNRKVNLKRVFLESTKDFSLGPIEKRECVLMNRKAFKNK